MCPAARTAAPERGRVVGFKRPTFWTGNGRVKFSIFAETKFALNPTKETDKPNLAVEYFDFHEVCRAPHGRISGEDNNLCSGFDQPSFE